MVPATSESRGLTSFLRELEVFVLAGIFHNLFVLQLAALTTETDHALTISHLFSLGHRQVRLRSGATNSCPSRYWHRLGSSAQEAAHHGRH